MPLDPVVQRRDVVEKSAFGGHDQVLTSEHEGNFEADGVTPAEDPYKEFDLYIARNVIRDLMRVYSGYPWAVKSDTAGHLLMISIPVLMGVNNWYVFNLRQTEATIGAILLAGGELLERYGCKRGKFQLDEYLAARELSSSLVIPSRAVPA